MKNITQENIDELIKINEQQSKLIQEYEHKIAQLEAQVSGSTYILAQQMLPLFAGLISAHEKGNSTIFWACAKNAKDILHKYTDFDDTDDWWIFSDVANQKK